LFKFLSFPEATLRVLSHDQEALQKERDEEELQSAILQAEAESARQRELWEWHEQRWEKCIMGVAF